jgi:hypothetical protein
MLTTGLSLTALILMPAAVDQPDPTRYRMELSMKNVADLTSAGMGEMITNVTGTVWFQLTMSDTTGGRIALIAVDSVNYEADGQAAMQFAPGLGAGVAGSTVRAYIKDGKVEGTPQFSVPAAENPITSLVIPALSALFPGISSNEARSSWVDTTNSETNNQAGSQVTEAIATWTINGREGNLLLIAGSTSSAVSSSTPEGQEMSGTIESKVSVKTPAGGPAQQTTITSDQDMAVLVPALPDPIPVKVNTSIKLATLP